MNLVAASGIAGIAKRSIQKARSAMGAVVILPFAMGLSSGSICRAAALEIPRPIGVTATDFVSGQMVRHVVERLHGPASVPTAKTRRVYAVSYGRRQVEVPVVNRFERPAPN